MPSCTTKYHGTIDYTDDKVLVFPFGLLGFEEQTQFLPLEVPSTRPIVYLQSLGTPTLCFIALPVRVIDGAYELAISAADAAYLGLPERFALPGSDVLCLALITIQTGRPTTANLLAPVVINLQTRVGLQIISTDSAYSHRHAFLSAEGVRACS